MLTFDQPSLIQWFQKEKRDLPWRENPSPYAVWISEVMLQQTQVLTVIPYFERWMARFPTIHHLAEASLDEVIKLWEGLGYYSRARHLHEGARYIVKFFQGHLPDNAEELSKIKGLGDYTIGALLSFAFHQRRAAVDGNVLRVLSRYFVIEDDIVKPKTVRSIRALAQTLLPENEPWVMAEALIELGAVICQKKPKCSLCPMRSTCQAHLQGKEETLPYKSKKTTTQYLYRAVAVLACQSHLLIQKIEEKKIMAGLHEFPYFETNPQGFAQEDFCSILQRHFNLTATPIKSLPVIHHAFTRYQVRLFPWLFTCSSLQEIEGYQWIHLDALPRLAFSSGHRQILRDIVI